MTSKVVSYKELFAEFISASDLFESKIVEQLHEEIGSDLMALKLKLSASNLTEKIKGEVDENINGLLLKIKNLSNQFYPVALDELGLLAALRSCVRRFNRFTNITVQLVEKFEPCLEMPLEGQRQLYYIIEELLIKIIEDSDQNSIFITVDESFGLVTVIIHDSQHICQTILSNEGFLSDLGIQKMHSRLNKMAATIVCEQINKAPKIKIIARNEESEG